jgi:hypothetical protein
MSILQALRHPMAAVAAVVRRLLKAVAAVALLHPAVVPFSLHWHDSGNSRRSPHRDRVTWRKA